MRSWNGWETSGKGAVDVVGVVAALVVVGFFVGFLTGPAAGDVMLFLVAASVLGLAYGIPALFPSRDD